MVDVWSGMVVGRELEWWGVGVDSDFKDLFLRIKRC